MSDMGQWLSDHRIVRIWLSDDRKAVIILWNDKRKTRMAMQGEVSLSTKDILNIVSLLTDDGSQS